MANIANPVQIYHPDLDATATVAAGSVGAWEAVGWEPVRPAEKPAKGTTPKPNTNQPPAGKSEED